jgi:hypothetical protein
MRIGGLRHFLAISSAFIIVSGLWHSAWAEAGAPEEKKYPHPHAVHLHARGGETANLSAGEIDDWPEFVRSLRDTLRAPISEKLFRLESRMLLVGIRPGMVTEDAKVSVISELNRQIADESLMSRLGSDVTSSPETKEWIAAYRKSGSPEDLRWLNRSVLSDILARVPRKQRKGVELAQITCTTCHEMSARQAGAVANGSASAISEREVMDCFSASMGGEKNLEECVEKAKVCRGFKIQGPGPLKNVIQRNNPEGAEGLLVAVHPEDPYTFKPMLKKLVCLECHSKARKVDKVVGADGKIKDIPLFYGAGSRNHK